MDDQCIDVERVAEILDLPADHPDRRHADECPRCRSLVASYRSFLRAEPVADSRIERARDLLDARIREAAQRWLPGEARTAPPPRPPWWRVFLRPAPVLAASAALVVVMVLWTTRSPEETVLRDDGKESRPFAVHTAEVGSDGSIRLSWNPMPGADQYEVRVYGPALGEVYRSPMTTETSLVVERVTLPADLPKTLDLTWRVYALSLGDVVEVSAPGSIRTP
jgi:hypothetical protein